MWNELIYLLLIVFGSFSFRDSPNVDAPNNKKSINDLTEKCKYQKKKKIVSIDYRFL